MADITFYFPTTGTAAHTDIAPAAIWDDIDELTRLPLNTTRGASGGATVNIYKSSNLHYACDRQYVSAALAARDWITADTFDVSFSWRDQASVGATFYLSIRVANADGSIAGTLYQGVINATNIYASWQTRHNDGVAVQNNVSMPTDGHIVIEVGLYSAANGGATVSYLTGENLSNAAPLNDTDVSGDVWPWLAFTYGAGPSPIGPSGAIASAEDVDGAAMMRGTIQSEV